MFVSASLPDRDASQARTVVIVAFDEVTASDVCGAADVFSIATRFHRPAGSAGYRVVLASPTGTPVRTFSGVTLKTTALEALDAATIDTLIVPGGAPPHDPPVPRDVVDWLAREGRRPRRLCGICTGTFLLAEAGIIGERRVTTHWQATETLTARYPALRIDPDRVYMHDCGLWTSGGFTAVLDLALALLEEDHGHAAAMDAARSIVVFVKRPGEQAQLSAALASQVAADRQFSRLHAWVMDRLADDLSVDVLAEQVGMTPRTFARRYAEQTGRTPAKTIETLRVEAALRALAESDASLKQIARRYGFGDEQNLRRSFLRQRGMNPEQYRRRAAAAAPGAASAAASDDA